MKRYYGKRFLAKLTKIIGYSFTQCVSWGQGESGRIACSDIPDFVKPVQKKLYTYRILSNQSNIPDFVRYTGFCRSPLKPKV